MGRHATSTATETNYYRWLTRRIKKQHCRIRDGKKTVLRWILMTHTVESTKKNNDHSGLISIIRIPESTSDLKNFLPCSALRNISLSERQEEVLTGRTSLLNYNNRHDKENGFHFTGGNFVFLLGILQLNQKAETKNK